MNEKNQPFNLEEWLESKKKGFSGKIPRADFIDKIKELNELSEKYKKENEVSAKQASELTGKLKTSQSDLTTLQKTIQENEALIKQKDKDITDLTSQITNLQEKLSGQDGELKILQQRPNLTPEKYRALLDNQEKHKEEELKPTNLPADWEKQLSDKKTIEENFAAIEEKNSALEKKLLEYEASVKQIEAKLIEAEKRPTAEDLQKAVQQEADKYKDYVKLEAKEKEAINNYAVIQKELEQKITAYEKLQTELERLKTELNQSRSSSKDSGGEIMTEIKKLFAGELFTILKEISTSLFSLQAEIAQLKKNYKAPEQSTSEVYSEKKLPADYEVLKRENRDLYELLKRIEKQLPKDK